MTYVRPSLRLTWSGMRATDMEGWRAAMAEKKGYEQFEALFGEAVVAEIGFHRPFLFYARPLDPFRIDITVSDFCDHTFERVLTVQDVEDMRDETGIGSSCSEFLEYLISSLSSDDVRLIFEGESTAKLVARKSKGMPNISIHLHKLCGLSSNDVMGNISLALFRDLKKSRAELMRESQRSGDLEKSLSIEKEKNEHLERRLDSFSFKRKVSRPKLSDNSTDTTTQKPPERPAKGDSPSGKMARRVAPANRRSKVRGAVLAEDEDQR